MELVPLGHACEAATHANVNSNKVATTRAAWANKALTVRTALSADLLTRPDCGVCKATKVALVSLFYQVYKLLILNNGPWPGRPF